MNKDKKKKKCILYPVHCNKSVLILYLDKLKHIPHYKDAEWKYNH